MVPLSMNEKNEKHRSVILFTLTIIFLIGLSFIPGGTSILGYKIKPIDLFIDIKPDSLLDYSSSSSGNNLNGNNYKSINNRELQNSNMEILRASINLTLIKNIFSFDKAEERINKHISKDVPITGNVSQMNYFFNAVKNSDNAKIRVAHFGDSGIEGDLITADIRKILQEKFGGNGAGMIAITSQDIMFRTTTKQTFSDNWTTYNVVVGNPDNLPLGMNGFVSVPNGPAWVKYEATGAYPDTKSFSTVRVFYTNAKKSALNYAFNDETQQSVSLIPGNDVKEITLNSTLNAKSFKLFTTMANQAEFFGVSLEDGNGVYVDNFPWRGNSGVAFRNVKEATLKDFNNLCNYKLIILQFGGNVASPIAKNYNWYENEMIKNIKHLKSIFPESSFLLLGVGDKSVKKGSKFVTDPGIPILIESQKKIAEETGIAFWNSFEAMGGINSMEDWVYSNPPLAMRDYTHVTAQGASKMGQMIAQAILNAYNN